MNRHMEGLGYAQNCSDKQSTCRCGRLLCNCQLPQDPCMSSEVVYEVLEQPEDEELEESKPMSLKSKLARRQQAEEAFLQQTRIVRAEVYVGCFALACRKQIALSVCYELFMKKVELRQKAPDFTMVGRADVFDDVALVENYKDAAHNMDEQLIIELQKRFDYYPQNGDMAKFLTVIKPAARHKGGLHLDVCAGTANMAISLSFIAKPRKVTLLEVSEDLIKRGVEKVRDCGLNGAIFDFYQVDLLQGPIPILEQHDSASLNAPTLTTSLDVIAFLHLFTGFHLKQGGLLFSWVPFGQTDPIIQFMTQCGFDVKYMCQCNHPVEASKANLAKYLEQGGTGMIHMRLLIFKKRRQHVILLDMIRVALHMNNEVYKKSKRIHRHKVCRGTLSLQKHFYLDVAIEDLTHQMSRVLMAAEHYNYREDCKVINTLDCDNAIQTTFGAEPAFIIKQHCSAIAGLRAMKTYTENHEVFLDLAADGFEQEIIESKLIEIEHFIMEEFASLNRVKFDDRDDEEIRKLLWLRKCGMNPSYSVQIESGETRVRLNLKDRSLSTAFTQETLDEGVADSIFERTKANLTINIAHVHKKYMKPMNKRKRISDWNVEELQSYLDPPSFKVYLQQYLTRYENCEGLFFRHDIRRFATRLMGVHEERVVKVHRGFYRLSRTGPRNGGDQISSNVSSRQDSDRDTSEEEFFMGQPMSKHDLLREVVNETFDYIEEDLAPKPEEEESDFAVMKHQRGPAFDLYGQGPSLRSHKSSPKASQSGALLKQQERASSQVNNSVIAYESERVTKLESMLEAERAKLKVQQFKNREHEKNLQEQFQQIQTLKTKSKQDLQEHTLANAREVRELKDELYKTKRKLQDATIEKRDRLTNKQVQLEQELEDAETRCHKAELRANSLQTSVECKEVEIDGLKETISALNKEHGDELKKIVNDSGELKDVRRRLDEAVREQKRVQNESEREKKRAKDLQSQLNDTQGKLSSVETALDKLKRDNEAGKDGRGYAITFKQRCGILEDNLQQAEEKHSEELKELAAQLEEEVSKTTKLEQEIHSLEEIKRDQESSIQNLSLDMSNISKDSQSNQLIWKADLEYFKNSLSEEREKVKNLTVELKKEKDNLGKVQVDLRTKERELSTTKDDGVRASKKAEEDMKNVAQTMKSNFQNLFQEINALPFADYWNASPSHQVNSMVQHVCRIMRTASQIHQRLELESKERTAERERKLKEFEEIQEQLRTAETEKIGIQQQLQFVNQQVSSSQLECEKLAQTITELRTRNDELKTELQQQTNKLIDATAKIATKDRDLEDLQQVKEKFNQGLGQEMTARNLLSAVQEELRKREVANGELMKKIALLERNQEEDGHLRTLSSNLQESNQKAQENMRQLLQFKEKDADTIKQQQYHMGFLQQELQVYSYHAMQTAEAAVEYREKLESAKARIVTLENYANSWENRDQAMLQELRETTQQVKLLAVSLEFTKTENRKSFEHINRQFEKMFNLVSKSSNQMGTLVNEIYRVGVTTKEFMHAMNIQINAFIEETNLTQTTQLRDEINKMAGMVHERFEQASKRIVEDVSNAVHFQECKTIDKAELEKELSKQGIANKEDAEKFVFEWKDAENAVVAVKDDTPIPWEEAFSNMNTDASQIKRHYGKTALGDQVTGLLDKDYLMAPEIVVVEPQEVTAPASTHEVATTLATAQGLPTPNGLSSQDVELINRAVQDGANTPGAYIVSVVTAGGPNSGTPSMTTQATPQLEEQSPDLSTRPYPLEGYEVDTLKGHEDTVQGSMQTLGNLNDQRCAELQQSLDAYERVNQDRMMSVSVAM